MTDHSRIVWLGADQVLAVLAKSKLVLVHWLDACRRAEQRDVAEIAKSEIGQDSYSPGFLVRDDETGVAIIQTALGDGTQGTDCLEIPRAYVRAVLPLAVRRQARAKKETAKPTEELP